MNHIIRSLIFLFFSLTAVAQTGQISGSTTPFANVSLRGTRLGTQSDASGGFTLPNVPAGGYQLSISTVSFASITQPVTGRAGETTPVAVVLTPSAAYLEEVVVTVSRRPENVKEVPSAMTIVGQRQIQEQTAMNTDITNILQHTVPGRWHGAHLQHRPDPAQAAGAGAHRRSAAVDAPAQRRPRPAHHRPVGH